MSSVKHGKEVSGLCPRCKEHLTIQLTHNRKPEGEKPHLNDLDETWGHGHYVGVCPHCGLKFSVNDFDVKGIHIMHEDLS